MQQDKNVQMISDDWVEAKYSEEKDGVEMHELPLNVSQKRIELYRSRLHQLGFARINSYQGRIHMAEFGGGFTDTTWSIGYIWSATPLSPIVQSAYEQQPNRDEWHISPIEGNCYLYHRR